jgi:hypothetical protein
MCGMRSKCILALGMGIALIGGCSRSLTNRANPVEAGVEGGGEFPSFLAGRWQARQQGWEFQFEPDGRISSAVISLGRVRIAPGKTTKAPTRSGNEALFTPGRWTVHYAPSTRELTVRITMEHVRIEMAGNLVEGSSTDIFVGPVDPSGRTWGPQWTTFTRYLGRTPEKKSFDLSTDPTYGETKPLIFDKIEREDP